MLNDFADFFKAFITGNSSPLKNRTRAPPPVLTYETFSDSPYLFKAVIELHIVRFFTN